MVMNFLKMYLRSSLKKIVEYVDRNEMKIKLTKTKVMLFSTCQKFDFIPNITLSGEASENVEIIKLLGLIIRSDLKWSLNTELRI